MKRGSNMHLRLSLLFAVFFVYSCTPGVDTHDREITTNFSSPDVDFLLPEYSESFAPLSYFENRDLFVEARVETLYHDNWVKLQFSPYSIPIPGFNSWYYYRLAYPAKENSQIMLFRNGVEILPIPEPPAFKGGVSWTYIKLDYFFREGVYFALPGKFSHPAEPAMITMTYLPDEISIRENELHLSGMQPADFVKRYITLDNETRYAFFVPGRSLLIFPGISVPVSAELQFGIAMLPYMQPTESLPIDFEIVFEDSDGGQFELFSKGVSLPVQNAGEGGGKWMDVRCSLDKIGGKTGSFSFVTRIPDGSADSLSQSGEQRPQEWLQRGAWSKPVITSPGYSKGESSEKDEVIQGLIFILVDTLRKDHLGCYGYPRPTTPVIDSLAETGILFGNAVSQSSWTRPSVASIFTSSYPRDIGILTEDYRERLPQGFPTLAGFFSVNGFLTCAMVTNAHLQPFFGLHQGFDSHLFFMEHADVLTDKAIAWIEKHRDLPFFLYIHYSDPHSPYKYHESFDFLPDYSGTVYDDPQLIFRPPDHPGAASTSMKQSDSRDSAPEEVKILTDPEIEKMKALYDGEIRFVDFHLGRLMSSIRELGLTDKLCIVFTSDHGEEFKDHGGYFHGYTVYEEQVGVPLIINMPGRNSDRVDNLVQSMDLAPTLCSIFEIPVEGAWDGVSFDALLDHATGTRRTGVISESWFRGCRKISSRTRNNKVIFDIGTGEWEFYDLMEGSEGTAEQGSTGSFAAEAESLRAWIDSHPVGGKIIREPDLGEIEPNQATVEQLRSLGYMN